MKLAFFPVSLAILATAHAQDSPPPLKPLPPIPQVTPPVTAPQQSAPAAGVVPLPVVNSAIAAVAALGNEVVQGRYQAALDSMNPLWKERTARRMGGMEKLDEQLAAATEEMVRQGISVLSFQPTGTPTGYEVGPGKKVETVNGASVETLIYTKWLVLVPTVKTFSMRINSKPVIIESTGYQVAISDKDKIAWTFIDGSSASISELRSLFINLPVDMKLPPLEKREIR